MSDEGPQAPGVPLSHPGRWVLHRVERTAWFTTRVTWRTPDAVTWFFMWAPMVGLYFLGIYLCWLAEKRRKPEYDVPESDDDLFLPHASIWPFEMGVGMSMAFTGIVLGWAFLVPGVLVLLHSIAGWIGQSRRRSSH